MSGSSHWRAPRRRRLLSSVGLGTAAVLGLTAAVTGGLAPTASAATASANQQLVDYDDFGSTDGLQLFGSTHQVGDRVRLTDADNGEVGVVWANQNLDPAQDFSTDFVLDLHDSHTDHAADGIDFVIQNSAAGNQSQGSSGGGMGYAGIRPSFAVEFDIYPNHDHGDPYGNARDEHVGFLANGDADNSHYPASWTSGSVPALYGNGPVHAWFDYIASTHDVRLYVGTTATKPSSPTLQITRDLSAEVGTHSAFIGFTAATGGYNAAQDVVSWHVTAARGANYDYTAPTTTDDVSADVATAPVPVTLTATDDAGGTGVAEVRYTIGDAANPPADPAGSDGQVYDEASKPTLLDGQVIRYAATDEAGNVETAHTSSPAAVTATVNRAGVDADRVGDTLHAINSVATPANAALSYQFVRVDQDGTQTDIPGATGDDYVITADDLGYRLGAVVTASAPGYRSASIRSDLTSPVTYRDTAAPVTTDDVPAGAATAPVSVTLTATDNQGGSGVAGIRYAIGTAAAPGDPDGADGQVYSASAKPTLLDGQSISYYATDGAGNKEATHTSQPAQVTATVATPTVQGDALVGATLRAAAATTPSDATVTYQWSRTRGTAKPKAIDGATGSTYTLTTADKGSTLTVTVTGAAPGYRTASATSAPTDTIAAPTPIPAFKVTADGGDQVGETRVAHTSLDSDPSVTLTYQWQTADNHGGYVDIAGAEARQPSYQLPPAVENIKVRVLVTATRNGLARQTGGAPLLIRAGDIEGHDPVVVTTTPRVGQQITGDVTVDRTDIDGLQRTYTWTFTGKKGFKTTLTGKTVTVPAGANAGFFTVRLTAPGYYNQELRSPKVDIGS